MKIRIGCARLLNYIYNVYMYKSGVVGNTLCVDGGKKRRDLSNRQNIFFHPAALAVSFYHMHPLFTDCLKTLIRLISTANNDDNN